jgi:hypothetical protein
VGLDLPGGERGFETCGWTLPTGCRLVGCVDPPRRQGTGSELLDGVESGNHARNRFDLQRGGSLNEGLPSPRTNLQAMLQVTLIAGEGHRCAATCKACNIWVLAVVGPGPSVDTASDATSCS